MNSYPIFASDMAYDEGYQARKSGKGDHEVPYLEGSEFYDVWLDGWYAADDDSFWGEE